MNIITRKYVLVCTREFLLKVDNQMKTCFDLIYNYLLISEKSKNKEENVKVSSAQKEVF